MQPLTNSLNGRGGPAGSVDVRAAGELEPRDVCNTGESWRPHVQPGMTTSTSPLIDKKKPHLTEVTASWGFGYLPSNRFLTDSGLKLTLQALGT